MRERPEFGGSSKTSRTRAPTSAWSWSAWNWWETRRWRSYELTASGRISGVPLDLETANVYDFAGDAIKRIRIFSDRQEALEILGMRE